MLLLDAVTSFSLEEGIRCRVIPDVSSPFVTHGEVPALIALEYFAQAAAAFCALRAIELGLPPRLGILLGARKMEISRDTLPVGVQMHVFAQDVWSGENTAQFDCTLELGGDILARGAINVCTTPVGA